MSWPRVDKDDYLAGLELLAREQEQDVEGAHSRALDFGGMVFGHVSTAGEGRAQ